MTCPAPRCPILSMTEAEIQAQCRLFASSLGLALWRNNSGAARNPGGRLVRYGLGHESGKLNQVWKSSDLIGAGPGGLFTAVEVKRAGWRWSGTQEEVAQWNFIQNVRQLGGVAGFVSSVEELRDLLSG